MVYLVVELNVLEELDHVGGVVDSRCETRQEPEVELEACHARAVAESEGHA